MPVTVETKKETTQTTTPKEPRRKTLEELFNEPCAVAITNTLMHQSFQIPGGGTESSLHPGRPGLKDMKLVYHPGYGLIGKNTKNGTTKYFVSPLPNVIVGHE